MDRKDLLKMKLWKKICITLAVVIACGAAGTFALYEAYIKPNYAIPLAEKAADIIKDENVQKEVSQLAQELAEQGVIDEDLLKQLTPDEIISNAETAQANSAAATDASGETQSTEDTSSGQAQTDASETDNGEAQSSSGKEQTASSASSSSESSSSSGNNSSSSESSSSSSGSSSSSSNSSSSSGSSSSSNSSSAKGDTAYERIKNAATPEEFARGSAILSKIDAGKFFSLMESDRSAAKEYLYSCLSSSEIQTALSLYAKYSNLL